MPEQRPPDRPNPSAGRTVVAVDQVVSHVRGLIERGELKPGGRLPSARELASRLGVSRPTVRTGLRWLATLGIVRSRQGAGTFITEGPPALASEPLNLLAALHGLSRDGLFEARRVLETGTSGLAAERATVDDLAAMSEEVTGMFASMEQPISFLAHDVQFHRAVATASRNPALGVLIDMLGSIFFERRRETIQAATDLRVTAEAHRRIYRAIRAHNAQAARAAMDDHLRDAQAAQATEAARTPGGDSARPAGPGKSVG